MSQPGRTSQLKIAVASNTFSQDETLKKAMLERFPNAYFNLTGRILAGAELIAFMGDSVGAIMGLEKMDAAFLDACPKLKVISKFGVGLDSVDLPGCKQRGIAVLSSPGVNAFAVAELTLGFMIALSRRIAIGAHFLKNGKWVKHGGVQTLGKKVGLIGLGHVGKNTARLLQAVGCTVMAYDILDLSEYARANQIEFAPLDRVISENDFVSIHIPLTEASRNLIGAAQLARMKSTAFLINTARGHLVDEKALAQALKSGKLAGAAFDVFAEEPTTNRELLDQENFIGTAHIGGNSRESIRAVGTAALTNLLKHYGIEG